MLGAVIAAVVGLISIPFSTPESEFDRVLLTVSPYVYAILVATYLFMGLKSIGPTDQGVLLLLGKPQKVLKPGFVFAPVPYSVWEVTNNVIEERFPDADRDRPDEKYEVLFGREHGGGQGPLRSTNVRPISFNVVYRISDPIDFLSHVGDFDTLRPLMRSAVVEALQAEFGKQSWEKSVEEIREVNARITHGITAMFSHWGVTLVAFRVDRIDYGRIVGAWEDLATSMVWRDEQRVRSEGEYITKRFEAEGEAVRQRVLAYARTDGYKDLAERVGKTTAEAQVILNAVAQALEGKNIDLKAFLVGRSIEEWVDRIIQGAKK